jgi:ATP-dependent phosphofructokinase / diphosphate-dependent phosphofructokinase
MIGIKDGWSRLLKESYMPLNLNTISGILPRGGSILGTSRTNPLKHRMALVKSCRILNRQEFIPSLP